MPTYVIIPAGELKGEFFRCSFEDACDKADHYARIYNKPYRVYRLHNSIYVSSANSEVYRTGPEAS